MNDTLDTVDGFLKGEHSPVITVKVETATLVGLGIAITIAALAAAFVIAAAKRL